MDHSDYCLPIEASISAIPIIENVLGAATDIVFEQAELSIVNSIPIDEDGNNPEAAVYVGDAKKLGKLPKKCFLCNRNYASQFTLNRHLTTQHKVKITPGNRVLQCPVDKCLRSFNYMGALRTHLKEFHHINLCDGVLLQFPTLEAFLTWKTEEEKRTHTKFVRPHGKYKRHDGAEVHQFYCHRSGYYNSEGKGIRKLKSQGSCKMGSVCPATITAYKLPMGTVDVKYHSTHVGHLTDLEELYLSHEERVKVNDMVSKSVSFSAILDHVRNMLCNEMTVINQFTEKDIKTIEKTFKLWTSEKQCQDEDLYIMTLIDELAGLGEDDPIVYHKLPWKENGMFSLDDVVVIVMNSLQVTMLKRFGEGGIVCIDTTSTGEKWDFFLVTLLTVDDLGQAYPVAFCLCNKINEETLTIFFSEIKKKTGNLRPKYFMSDDVTAMNDDSDLRFVLWNRYMGTSEERICSSWHVDREWRKHLSKVAGKPYQKATAYKAMRVLLKEPNLTKFSLLLCALMKHLTEGKYTEPFGKYLQGSWVKRCKQWAFCYRAPDCVRYDLGLESMHLMLKHIYPEGSVKRLDTTLQGLFRFVRDKSFSQVMKHDVEQCMVRMTISKNRHHWSLSLSLKNVFPIETSKWIVKSPQGEFLVEQCIDACDADSGCILHCAPCNLCVHMFTCTCTDSVIRGILCKHIHLVGRYLRDVVPNIEVVAPQQPDSEFIIVTEGQDLSSNVFQQIASVTVSDTAYVEKRADLINEIVAYSQQISINSKDINDFKILEELREGLKQLVDVSQCTSLATSSSDSGNIICVPLQDFQAVLGNEESL